MSQIFTGLFAERYCEVYLLLSAMLGQSLFRDNLSSKNLLRVDISELIALGEATLQDKGSKNNITRWQ